MGLINKSALLGALATLAATVLLGLVAFDVPYFKSVYFLRAALPINGNGTTPYIVDFGVLGFCGNFQGSNVVNCTSPHIGYEIDANLLLDNTSPVRIPIGLVKSLTSALVLHVVAFALSVIALAFALLSLLHFPIADCFSSCFNGFAGSAAFVAFVFDIVFFVVIKNRLNDHNVGSATLGNAIILMVIAWILMFLTPCFYLLGRCCGCCVGGGGRGKNYHDKY